jgi:hypothetical protein
MRLPKNLGMLLLAIWLILFGLTGLFLNFRYQVEVLAIVAIAAGVALLLQR